MTGWTKNPRVVATDLEQETVLLDPQTRRLFTLNLTGRVVWDRIEDGLADVIAVIVARFEVDEESARIDSCALIDRLCEAGLVTRRDP